MGSKWDQTNPSNLEIPAKLPAKNPLCCKTVKGDCIRGTGYGVYNAVAGYFQNMKTFRNDEVKMKSIVLGGLSAQYSQRVFDRLVRS